MMDSYCVLSAHFAQIVYDLLVPRGKNTTKTGQSLQSAEFEKCRGFEGGTLTFDSLRFHSIRDPIILFNSVRCAFCHCRP